MLKTGIQTKTILEELGLAEGVRAVREAGFACLDYNLNDLIPQQHIYRKRSYELLPEVLKLSSFVNNSAVWISNSLASAFFLPLEASLYAKSIRTRYL